MQKNGVGGISCQRASLASGFIRAHAGGKAIGHRRGNVGETPRTKTETVPATLLFEPQHSTTLPCHDAT